MTIEIINMRKDKPKDHLLDHKIDRSSPLGNPFFMLNETYRNKVCDRYQLWFDEKPLDSAINKELTHLLKVYRDHGILRLFCWCAPKRCHGETIKKWLEDHI